VNYTCVYFAKTTFGLIHPIKFTLKPTWLIMRKCPLFWHF